MAKTYDRVKTILEKHIETRNSDKMLIWAYWVTEGLAGDYITAHDFLKVTSPESIRRARQKIQELHSELGPTSELVKKRRGIKSATKGTFIFREQSSMI